MPVIIDNQYQKIQLIDKRKTKNWIKKSINKYKKRTGDITVVFTTDDELLFYNKKYLKRNNYTDIITFNYNHGSTISGDLLISIDSIKRNHIKYNESFEEELRRVIIHGILHLIGFDDKNDEEKKIMRNKEDELLKAYKDNEY